MALNKKIEKNMKSSHRTTGLTEILNSLSEKTNGEYLSFGQILNTLEYRGFGPLLLVPSLIIILPTGIIPGIPAICGVFIFLISAQIILGYVHPWLPQKLKKFSIQKSKFEKAFEKIKPYTEKLDKRFGKRLTYLTENTISIKIVALMSMVLASGIVFIGFIPALPVVLVLPILLFALGLSVADGALLAAGYCAIGLVALALPFI